MITNQLVTTKARMDISYISAYGYQHKLSLQEITKIGVYG